MDLFRVRRELRGDAQRLFFYLTKRISGYTIDEIKYFGGFRDRALINRCLAEMKRLGIVERQGDKYCVPRPVAEAVSFAFRHYAKIGNKLIAKGFVSTIAYVFLLLIIVATHPGATSMLPLGLTFTSMFIAIGAYETYRMRSLAKMLRGANPAQ